MRVLLVEDDDRIAKPLAEDLRHQHYVVDVAADGESGWHYTQTADYELILLDIMLPRLDGISLCQQLRRSGYSGFVLMLTAKDTLTDKVMGLDAGADDYVVKPFELDELAARIRALCRRPPQIQPSILEHGELRLDPIHHHAHYGETLLDLTPKEYILLEHLLQHPGQVFTRAMLLDRLWELDRASSEGTVKTHISNLRCKLKAAGGADQLIETLYGVGYRLNPLLHS
ncbi:response regulator transcription factor [Acaryochloris sp. IP29b_bin.148]|uniref:response regulator transcription factor n=1 Tax=Acaryochloris sp. IP29b_bin.148 TaxID=2969218 RepID=UPI00260A36C0|nr:response regulator transcription factor [Acaryochloris sp. IP29b_bin.148]